ncbi:hypothetical protein PFHG_02729 [Plasmodium falciparum HB3]|uniref:Uncharacterized protein n=1 Tax=Plasmodium falciparum (isolate HB3) TaxID=137071 RepID=A0A0L7KCB6_PLAFX|nr:hypothetical protein PFHG_02729 [Plasmodium falciparum HB3]
MNKYIYIFIYLFFCILSNSCIFYGKLLKMNLVDYEISSDEENEEDEKDVKGKIYERSDEHIENFPELSNDLVNNKNEKNHITYNDDAFLLKEGETQTMDLIRERCEETL